MQRLSDTYWVKAIKAINHIQWMRIGLMQVMLLLLFCAVSAANLECNNTTHNNSLCNATDMWLSSQQMTIGFRLKINSSVNSSMNNLMDNSTNNNISAINCPLCNVSLVKLIPQSPGYGIGVYYSINFSMHDSNESLMNRTPDEVSCVLYDFLGNPLSALATRVVIDSNEDSNGNSNEGSNLHNITCAINFSGLSYLSVDNTTIVGNRNSRSGTAEDAEGNDSLTEDSFVNYRIILSEDTASYQIEEFKIENQKHLPDEADVFDTFIEANNMTPVDMNVSNVFQRNGSDNTSYYYLLINDDMIGVYDTNTIDLTLNDTSINTSTYAPINSSLIISGMGQGNSMESDSLDNVFALLGEIGSASAALNGTETSVQNYSIANEDGKAIASLVTVGQPVEWRRNISLNHRSGVFRLNISREAYNEKIIAVDGSKREVIQPELNLLAEGRRTKSSGKSLHEDESREIGFNLSSPAETLEVTFLTPGPSINEETLGSGRKLLNISSDTHYENILAYSDIDESPEGSVRLYWIVNGTRQKVEDVNFTDTNGNKMIDRVYWRVPHLSSQLYEIVIAAIDAEHLDSSRQYISNIYFEVSTRDGVWSEMIPAGDFVRVQFELNLTSKNDITLYAQSDFEGNGIAGIEIYAKDTAEPVARIENIGAGDFYHANLSGLEGNSDTFYLKVLGTGIMIDYIYDPATILTLDINTPEGDVSITGNEDLNWTATSTAPVLCNLSIDNALNSSNIAVTSGVMYNASFTGLAVGRHTWNVSCWDADGNINSSALGTFYIATPVYDCGILNAASTYYLLMNNVTNNKTCFNITAGNVTLDGSGYTINYSANGTVGYGIFNTKSNVTLKNMIVLEGSPTTAYKMGIYLNSVNSSSTLVINNSIRILYQSNAVRIESTNASIINNTITAAGSGLNSYPIQSILAAASNLYIYGNHINVTSGSATTCHGMYFTMGGGGKKIINNTISTPGLGYGIYSITGGLANSTIANNTLNVSAAVFGIYIDSSPNVTLSGNVVSTTVGQGYGFAGTLVSHFNHSLDTTNMAEGMPVYYSFNVNNQTWLSNTDYSSTYGELMCGWCNNITIQNITMGYDGIMLGGTNNSLLNGSVINATTGHGITISGYYNVINNNTVNTMSTDQIPVYPLNDWNNITNNILVANADAYGLWLNNVGYTQVINNSIRSVAGYTLYISASSLNNNIVGNNITSASSALMMDTQSTGNNFIGNNFSSSGNAVIVQVRRGSSNCYFGDNIISTMSTYGGVRAINFGITSDGAVNGTVFNRTRINLKSAGQIGIAIQNTGGPIGFQFIDGVMNVSSGLDFAAGNGITNGYWNFTNSSEVNGSNMFYNWTTNAYGSLMQFWYLDVNVTNSTGQLDSANVTVWNASGSVIYSQNTSAAGYVPQMTLLEYIRNNTAYNYATAYGINVTREGYLPYSNSSINLTGSMQLNITLLQNQSPAVTPVSPLNLSYYNQSTLFLNVSVMTNTNISYCWLSLDNGTNTTMSRVNDSYFYNQSTLADGIHDVIYYCNDTYGNANQTSVTVFTVDTTKPGVALVSPANSSNVTLPSVAFIWNATDSIDLVLSCNLTLEGTLLSSGIASTSGANTSQAGYVGTEGVKNWSVACSDDTGNTQTSAVGTFNMSYASLNISVIYPPNTSNVSGVSAMPGLNWSVWGNTSTYEMIVYGSNNTGYLDRSILYHGRGLSNGSYYYNWTSQLLQPDSQVAALFRFENLSRYLENSTFFHDYSSNGNNATCSLCPGFSSLGRFGWAANFSQQGEVITASSSNSLNIAADITLYAWISRSSDPAASGADWSIIEKGGSYKMMVNSTDGNPYCAFNISGTQRIIELNQSLSPGWNQLVCTYNGSSVSIYINGGLSRSQDYSGAISTTASGLAIGNSLLAENPANASLDEIAVLSRSMPGSEISGLYSLESGNYYWNINVTDTLFNKTSGLLWFNYNSSGASVVEYAGFITKPESPVENDMVYISVSLEGDNVLWANYSVGSPNGSLIIDNENASANADGLWNSSAFLMDSVGVWNWSLAYYWGSTVAYANGTITIPLFETLQGFINGNYIVSGPENGAPLINWNVSNFSNISIYIADADSSVEFGELAGLGYNATGFGFNYSDFEVADAFMGNSNLSDSLNNTFTLGGVPLALHNFTVLGEPVLNVPVINSSNSSKFITGIMWDKSDDTNSTGTYNAMAHEDIVLVSTLRPGAEANLSVYDYELAFPSTLKRYKSTTTNYVMLYAELK